LRKSEHLIKSHT